MYPDLSQFISKMDLSLPTHDEMGLWSFPRQHVSDWRRIQGFDFAILMYTHFPPSCARCAESTWHHCKHNAAMQCLLTQQSLCYQIYNFVQNSWNTYSIYFSVAGASLKYSCKLVFRKLQLEYNGTHLETYTSNSIPLMNSQMWLHT